MSKTPELKFSVRMEGMDMVFTDPDGDEHVCGDPGDVWELLFDFTGQVLEKSLATTTAKTANGRQKSRKDRVMEDRERERKARGQARGPESDQDNQLARQAESTSVQRHTPEPESAPEPEPAEGEQPDFFARAFGKIGEVVVRKSGDVSRGSKWGRGGRVSTMKR